MPVIVPALPCCWAKAKPQKVMAATVMMMPGVFIGLSRFPLMAQGAAAGFGSVERRNVA
jgi:hypothetical protein